MQECTNKNIIFDCDLKNAGVSKYEFEEVLEKLKQETENIKEVLSQAKESDFSEYKDCACKNGEFENRAYQTDYASVCLPYDKTCLGSVKSLCEKKKKLNISTLFVIGIGGSNLSTMAVHKAIHGDFCNDKDLDIKVYFADTVDNDYICDLLVIAENKLKNGENILINLITKSGTTTESIANFEVFLHLIKKYRPDNYYDYIVIITDYGSNLWSYAKTNKIDCLQVPAKVGGRYSVFSSVGLFPLCFLGINVDKMLEGARDIIGKIFCDKLNFNIAAESAATIYLNYKSGKNIHDTFIFSKYLRGFGAWYRQLVAESLGKKFDKTGKKVEVGITPIVSVGTVDLHSMVQLYLGGPRDKFTTFLLCKHDLLCANGMENNCEIFIPEEGDFEEFVEKIHGKSLNFIMDVLARGTQEAYKNDSRPFVSIIMPQVNEYFLGQLLQMKMLEIIYLGFLLGVNPFDQPQVQLYKDEAIKIMLR